MDPSLVNELADRLGTSTMEARIALADLLQDTREELEQHGAAQLPGLGTFRREGRAPSRITFQPEALLADAANHAFAGLEALTVPDPTAKAEAPDEAPAADPEPADPEPLSENVVPPPPEAPPAPSGEAPSGEAPSGEAPFEPLDTPEHAAAEPRAEDPETTAPHADEPDPYAPFESPPEEPTPAPSNVEGTPPSAAKRYETGAPELDAPEADDDAPPPHADSEPLREERNVPVRSAPEPPAQETPAPLPIQKVDWESVLQDTPYAVMPAAGYLHGGPTRADLEAATLEAPTPQPPVTRVPDHPPAARSSTRRRSPALPWIAAAALILVALAAGLWYVMQPDERAELHNPPTAEREAAPATSPSPNIAAGAASTPDTAAAPPAEQEPADEEPAAEEPAEEPLAPVLDPAPGDWTAVAASRPTRAEADVLARQYRVQLGASGAPVGVIAGEVDGDQFFRVAVGRFGSFEETQTFLQRAGSSLPADAWALQIEP